ncbi:MULTISPECIES: potassium-transporting ATPase subunit C [Gordonia]|uniref:Potassium-transporting ATPase KdpC subunit n=1 Tax=Gordonia amicalis TaxID=89053 RepID=A0AAE4U8N3_9ACTN|nr:MULTISPECIES: potassium-transporting ATPase subunit C [Gordonia]ATD73259.1 K+-transporting ATPase subunit C [Gordonia sp. 1D]MCR8895921.1 potassium-transporting ATPase subunit C [Gordonia sp. GONU]MCZ4578684.1 potassium-transporting ATPase subunit C [Gordonia amicalis]MDJ0452512.1 potassium-transporting ATPase subunit C [Gordonia amicalis]MDV6309622.1 potassium-transporting ATPase subunit C [Gordonia amicalis]
MKMIVTGLLRQSVAALGMLLGLTLILGFAYPAAVWAISRVDSSSAEGSRLVDASGCVVGSSLIGLDPQVPAGGPDPYLHARVLGAEGAPMVTGDPSASAASNQGPNSVILLDNIEDRRAFIADREGVAPQAVPADAVTGSGSGLDPHISPAYAELQVPRLARENRLSPEVIRSLIAAHTQGRQWGFLGEPSVDVPSVNLALGHGPATCHTR